MSEKSINKVKSHARSAIIPLSINIYMSVQKTVSYLCVGMGVVEMF